MEKKGTRVEVEIVDKVTEVIKKIEQTKVELKVTDKIVEVPMITEIHKEVIKEIEIEKRVV